MVISLHHNIESGHEECLNYHLKSTIIIPSHWYFPIPYWLTKEYLKITRDIMLLVRFPWKIISSGNNRSDSKRVSAILILKSLTEYRWATIFLFPVFLRHQGVILTEFSDRFFRHKLWASEDTRFIPFQFAFRGLHAHPQHSSEKSA